MKDGIGITLVQFSEQTDGPPVPTRMAAWFEKAATAGSDIIVFPEYALGRQIDIDHPHVEQFRALAARHGMYAIAGLIENAGSRWMTSALVVNRDGSLLGRYLKTHPAAGPDPHNLPPLPGEDHEARGILGSGFPVFHLDFGPISILQCYDGMFLEAWACAGWSGAEILFWINGRTSMIQDAFCIAAAHSCGVVVGACVSNGWNTGFAEPRTSCINAPGTAEEMRLFPRIPQAGDAAVHARVDLAALRVHRKHLRTMHQRRPDLYGALTQHVCAWHQYPHIPWIHPDCEKYVNRAQL